MNRIKGTFLLLAALLLCGCQVKKLPEKAVYDTGITADSLKSIAAVTEEELAALDGRLEAYNRSSGEALARGPALPVLDLCREGDIITLRPAGLALSPCTDREGETAQCVFAGALKGDISRGYGGDWKRYGLELLRSEEAGLTPLAYVDLGVSAFVPVLLVQEKQDVRVLWYADPGALCYAADGSPDPDYQSGVTGDTPWSLESPEMLMEGYERYLEMCALHPGNYLGLRWLSREDYQAGLNK